ncbi:4Fe-4S binding protein [Patescibacteria group bacterium]|nr:4Fe-4S binding protein [Patescibacteria group bacterium]
MKVYRIRYLIQILSFLFLIYGGYLGLRAGNLFPAQQCSNNDSYLGGGCYLLPLQRLQYGIKMDPEKERGMMPFPGYTIIWRCSGAYLRLFLSFFVVALIFSKFWCGWACPFGTFQDWIASMRRRFSIRECQISYRTKRNLRIVKYILLILFLGVHFYLISDFPRDIDPPYCRICPVKLFLPPFEGNFLNQAVDFTVGIQRFWTSIATSALAGIVLVGIMFRDRIFCLICPVGALFDTFRRIGLPRLKKQADSCTGCGNCWRVCPMDIKEVYLEKKEKDVLKENCNLCLKCIEACPQDKALSATFLKKNIISSSKKYFSDWFKRRHRLQW